MRQFTLALAAVTTLCLVADTAQAFGRRKRNKGCDTCATAAPAPVATGCGGCGAVAYQAGYQPGVAYGFQQDGYIAPQQMPNITQASANEVKVRLTDSTTDLTPLNITAGTTVRWINDSKVARMVSSSKGDWTSNEIAPGQEFVATFTKPGTFEFFCGSASNVKNQKGTINVQ